MGQQSEGIDCEPVKWCAKVNSGYIQTVDTQYRMRVLSLTLESKGHGKGKGKRSIAVRKNPHLYGNSRAIWDHTFTCHPTEVNSRLYPQPKLVLD